MSHLRQIAIVSPSDRVGKRYKVEVFLAKEPINKRTLTTIRMVPGSLRTIHFGSNKYNNYILWREQAKNHPVASKERREAFKYANERKKSFIARHGVDDGFSDPYSARFWSRFLLWNKGSLKASADDISKEYGIKVHLKL